MEAIGEVINSIVGMKDETSFFQTEESERLLKNLEITRKIAKEGYFITSGELASLMGINPGAVTGRGEEFVYRNWIANRVRREGNQILWQLSEV